MMLYTLRRLFAILHNNDDKSTIVNYNRASKFKVISVSFLASLQLHRNLPLSINSLIP